MTNRTITPAELGDQDERNAWLAAFKISWDYVQPAEGDAGSRLDAKAIRREQIKDELIARVAALSPHPDVLDVDRDEVRCLIMAAKYVTS